MATQQARVVADDAWLFGWNATPGIVSVWADRSGRALLWQRHGAQVRCTEERFRPWVFAATLDHVEHLGGALVADSVDVPSSSPFSYRELDGPSSSFRYLLSARDGRALERVILTGATQRLSRKVKSLYDLEDQYYWVGPVEQYLMATGRVYFRNLTYTDLHRLQFDLETTSLNPHRGRIFLIAVRDSRGFETILEAPTANDEPHMIAELCALIRARDPDVIENHNLFGFDLPFLEQRAQTLGVPIQLGRAEGPPLLDSYEEPGGFRRRRRRRYSVAGRELIDTLEAVRRYDFAARDMPGHGLKAAARYFGVAAPERTYLAGAEIYSTYQREPEQVRRYALDDVTEVDGLSCQLMGAAFALAGMAPRRYERVAGAGPAMGILEPMLVRAYLHSGAALPRQATDSDAVVGAHAGGATYLYAAGVAEQVVKADVASMYPSIMRTFHIGPACDQLGALLYLVDRLTDLRLLHKNAVRNAATETEASQHQAIQAAMKILINSAYGYMGAGSMALFADRAAADEVTRRGREILNQVAEALRARGMALLEADTDGVYFAAPVGWTEEQERELVSAVAETLPSTIRLEYEGRYQAMLVHEVKNYALLTYKEDLIVRGVALRSSRSEPFGDRFLREALRYTLIGDMDNLRRVYQETMAAIRDSLLTNADVAAVARLSKTPEAYLTSRSRLKEAPYEALLSAGRTSWQVGERVRFYKAADGANVWLPDVSDEEVIDDEDDEEEREGEVTATAEPQMRIDERSNYDVSNYLQVFHGSYVSRLKKAFAPEDFGQLFRPDGQLGLFDLPIDDIQPRWIRCEHSTKSS